jgi:hypothetical protein
LNENFNKNYRLPPKRLYGRRILENHDFREKVCKRLLGKGNGVKP